MKDDKCWLWRGLAGLFGILAAIGWCGLIIGAVATMEVRNKADQCWSEVSMYANDCAGGNGDVPVFIIVPPYVPQDGGDYRPAIVFDAYGSVYALEGGCDD